MSIHGKQAGERVAVVGVDLTESGDDALAHGLAWLAANEARTLHLLHVLDPRSVSHDAQKSALETQAEVLAQIPHQLRQRAKLLALMFQVEPSLASDPSRLRTHSRIGQPVETLLQACVDYDADLLLVGTHGRRGVERLLLGSVSEAVVRKARCPVIVARRKDYSDCVKTPLPDAPYGPGEHRPDAHFESRHELVSSTESAGWHPSDSGPTGIRIV